MSSIKEELRCRRCGRPVGASAGQYQIFEGMHYVCFHYEFEHDPADPDQECEAGGCPSGAMGGGRDMVAGTARRLSAQASTMQGWKNENLPAYLEALAAWLDDCGGYYANQGRLLPSNAWVIINDALQAAGGHELAVKRPLTVRWPS